jgi:MurNAc alpha-1-phosphate uridylyltransferase
MDKIKSAMILAAGFGSRMGELTAKLPKPAIKIHGKSFVHRILDLLLEHDVRRVIINSHYLADKLLEDINSYPNLESFKIDFLFEPMLLETAGGVLNALSTIPDDNFYVINGDVLYAEYSLPPLSLLENHFDDQLMDCLLLLHPKEKVFGYYGDGDFNINAVNNQKFGNLITSNLKPYIHAGIYIFNKRFFAGLEHGVRKMMDVFARNLLSDGVFERIYGVVNDGICLHIGDKNAYNELDRYLIDNNIKL